MTGVGGMEARPEGTQNVESSAKQSASFKERKEHHGNIGKGRVEATSHSKGRDSGGEDEGKQKRRTGDRSSPGKLAGSNMAVADDCEPCKGVASPNGVAHSRYPENLINEENWTSGSTQNKDGSGDSQRKVSHRYGFVSQCFEWVQQWKSAWLTLKSTTLQAKGYVVPRVESSCLWARTCLINIARLWLVVFVLWLNCCIRGIGSFLHLGMAAFSVLLWCSFLSSIAIAGFIYVLSTMVITCVAAFFLGNTHGILIMFSLGALMLWMYGSFWITGTLVLIGGIFLASSYPHIAILITNMYSVYCAKVHVGWLGLVFCVNMAFISSDILLYFFKESMNESKGKTSSDQAESSKSRGRHFYNESTKPYSSNGGVGSSGRSPGESFRTSQFGGCNTGPSTDGQTESVSNLAKEEVMRLLDSPDYYETLGLSRFEDINSATLKRDYRKKAMLVHPDKNMGNVKAEEAFKKLQNAYEVLLDSGKKKIYDEELQREELLRNLDMFQSGSKKNGRYSASEHGFFFAEDDFEDSHVESRIIDCKKCSGSHIWIHTGRAKTRARWCQDCQDYHQAKDGDGWIEQSFQLFFFGMLQKADLPRAYACVDSRIFDVTEWVACQGMKCTPNTHKPTFQVNTNVMGKSPARGRSQGYKDTACGGMPTNLNENMTEEEFFEWLANAMATGIFDSGDGAQEKSNMETNSHAKNSKKRRKGKRQF